MLSKIKLKHCATAAFVAAFVIFYSLFTVQTFQNAKIATHEDAVPWTLLTKAYEEKLSREKQTKEKAIEKVKELEGKEIQLYGYMFPTEQGEKHSKFLLTAKTTSCPFCFPGNAGDMVEVQMDEPIPYSRNPILLRGKFDKLKSMNEGLMYGMHDAQVMP